MIIQHNLPAMNSHRQLGINNATTSKNLEKLSSGYRINRAGDDAAGLAISEKMRGQIRGLTMATQNAQNGVSLIQTAEGGLNETHAILQRMRELAVQSANGTYDDDVDRANLAKEAEALKSEIDRIASATNYNGINLLDGTMGGQKAKDMDDEGVTTKRDEALTKLGLTGADAFVLDGTNGKDLEGAAATLVVTKADTETGASATISLQIGDKTYSLSTVDNKSFVDADGMTIGAFTTTGFDPTSVDPSESGVVKLDSVTTDAAGTKLNADASVIAGESAKLVFQIGANGSLDQRVGLHVDNMSTGNLGGGKPADLLTGNKVKDIDISTREKANESIRVIDAATNQVSGTRADLGALQNRLEHTINNLGVTRENLQAAESTIRDVDMAKEMMEFTKNNILVQASQAMLAQSNQLPQGVLQLLK